MDDASLSSRKQFLIIGEMEMRTKYYGFRNFALSIAAGAFLFVGQSALAQVAGDNASKQMKDMPQQCQAMMAKKNERMAKMQEADTQLQQKLATMNKAQGQAKVDAMAAILTQMVNQRAEMREQMMSMSDDGMKHMMGHMGNQDAMKNCPMMSKPAADHSGH